MQPETQLQPEQMKAYKAKGFLHNRGTDCFSARVITKNGTMTAEQMQVLCDAAKQYGNGQISFTVRMTVEVPGIAWHHIDAFCAYIARADLTVGGTGAKIRPVVACKGSLCENGLCDTFSLAEEIHNRFYEALHDVVLPHKFKIAVGGCPNHCVKPDTNDIGIVGQRIPVLDMDACKGCSKCGMVSSCPMQAAYMQDGKIAIDSARCNGCGTCIAHCAFHIATAGSPLFRVYVGGRWGKQARIATPIQHLFSEQELMDAIQKAIALYQQYGYRGERFADTVERLGMDKVEAAVLSDACHG